MAILDDKDEFERVHVENTQVVDPTKFDFGGEYTEEKLQMYSIDELHHIIKNNDLPKETLKLIKRIIKQKKHER